MIKPINYFYQCARKEFGHQFAKTFGHTNDIDTIVADVYLSMAKRRPEPSSTYIMRKITWELLDLYRKHKRREDILKSFDQFVAVDDEFNHIKYSLLYNALKSLPYSSKKLLYRYHIQRLSFVDIAALYDLAPMTIARRMNRIYLQIRKEMYGTKRCDRSGNVRPVYSATY